MNFEEQLHFLKHEWIPLIKKIHPAEPARWGKMDVQQMAEHLRDVMKVASGKILLPLVTTDAERLEKMRAFLLSDIPFKENTRSPVMPEVPRPHKYASLEEAIALLEPELEAVFTAYESQPGRQILNPVFGELNYEQQTALLYKHVTHHLRQFGLIV